MKCFIPLFFVLHTFISYAFRRRIRYDRPRPCVGSLGHLLLRMKLTNGDRHMKPTWWVCVRVCVGVFVSVCFMGDCCVLPPSLCLHSSWCCENHIMMVERSSPEDLQNTLIKTFSKNKFFFFFRTTFITHKRPCSNEPLQTSHLCSFEAAVLIQNVQVLTCP